MNKFNVGDTVIYTPFLKRITLGGKVISEDGRDCVGYITKVNEEHCLGTYYTYKITMNDERTFERADEYKLCLYS